MSEQLTAEQQQLVETAMPLVRNLARRMAGTWIGITVNDMISAGAFALVRAVLTFQPAMGTPFEGYAFRAVRGAMLNEIAKLRGEKLGRLRRMAASDARSQAEIQSNMTLDDLMSEDAADPVQEAYELLQARAAGMLFALVEPALNPEEMNEALGAQARLRRAFEGLPEREQASVRAVYFDELTLDQAAERLGVSTRTVRRDVQSAKEKFAKALAA